MGVRLPTILGKAIDDVVKTLNDEVRWLAGGTYSQRTSLTYRIVRSTTRRRSST